MEDSPFTKCAWFSSPTLSGARIIRVSGARLKSTRLGPGSYTIVTDVVEGSGASVDVVGSTVGSTEDEVATGDAVGCDVVVPRIDTETEVVAMTVVVRGIDVVVVEVVEEDAPVLVVPIGPGSSTSGWVSAAIPRTGAGRTIRRFA